MKDILLLRHCEHGLAGYIGSGTDLPLSDEGKAHAEHLSPVLSSFKPDFIFSSPMQRCLQTIELFLKTVTAPPPVLSEELRELDFGLWEGKTYSEIYKTDKNLLDLWITNPVECAPPEGEKLGHMYQRVLNFWEEKILRGEDGRYLIISHAGPVKCILSKEIKAGMDGYWLFQIDKGRFSHLNIFEDKNVLIRGINIKEI